LWIDYYLERKKIIDELIEAPSQRQLPTPRTAKRPTFSVKREKTELVSAPSVTKREKTSQPVTTSAPPVSTRTGRNTINSMSAHYFAPEDRLLLSSPPSREPTPPSEAVTNVTKRGNAYTRADEKYMAKYVAWATAKNPQVTKAQLLRRIARRVPIQFHAVQLSF
jgi:hypothetical protein